MEYWAKRELMSEKAVKHTEHMESYFSQQIDYSFNKSKIYDELYKNFEELPYGNYIGKIEVVDMTSSNAAYYARSIESGKIAILNFASFKNPGGKFINGSMAQEESLCHVSCLYNILQRFDSTFYEYNRKHLNRSMYLDRAIYSPGVVFCVENQGFDMFDIITCAAPNIGAASKYCGISSTENQQALISRCKLVLDIAQQNMVDVLILGAFGCGVFRQNPYTVANTFKYLLDLNMYRFKRVIFAIPNNGHSSKNYMEFVNVFCK